MRTLRDRSELRIPTGGGTSTAVTIVAPDKPDGTAIFAFPGGGYNRSYFDRGMPGPSQAEWHASRGWTRCVLRPSRRRLE